MDRNGLHGVTMTVSRPNAKSREGLFRGIRASCTCQTWAQRFVAVSLYTGDDLIDSLNARLGRSLAAAVTGGRRDVALSASRS